MHKLALSPYPADGIRTPRGHVIPHLALLLHPSRAKCDILKNSEGLAVLVQSKRVRAAIN